MTGFLTRRIWIFPVWLWFILLVVATYIIIRIRQAKTPDTGLNSDATTAPNLTNQPGGLMPYGGDVFVNIQQPGAQGPPGPPGPGTNTPPPPDRVTSVTLPNIPQFVDIPGDTSLYDYAQSLEQNYTNWAPTWTNGVFARLKELLPITWRAPRPGEGGNGGNIPILTSGQRVQLW